MLSQESEKGKLASRKRKALWKKWEVTWHRPGMYLVEQHKQKLRGREECDSLEHISVWELPGNKSEKVLESFKCQAEEFNL